MKRYLLIFFFVIPCMFNTLHADSGQRRKGPYSRFEDAIYTHKQMELLSWLSDDMCRGRATGTVECEMAAHFIASQFERYGVEKLFPDSYFQQFQVDSATRGRNVVGIVRSVVPSDEYIVVCAHYDHLGVLKDVVYNGADDNASGVVAMLNLAEIFSLMKFTKTGPSKNIIFVALDAKECNMAGSNYFVNHLPLSKKKVICAVNMERLGTVLEPVHEGVEDFIIVLGHNTLKKEDRSKIAYANVHYDIWLDIDYTFYGSDSFSKLYYKLSDQIVFHNAGIPALLFTAGFHKYTYKPEDDVEIISTEVLRKRTLLIYYFLLNI